MPVDEHKPPFRIEGQLGALRVWQVMEAQMSLRVACEACGHESLWTPAYMRRKLARAKGATLIRVAGKMRCGGCRSSFLRIWKG